MSLCRFAAIDVVAFGGRHPGLHQQPGAPTVSLTLQAGQHYTNCNGYTPGRSPATRARSTASRGGGSVTINAGTKIRSTKPWRSSCSPAHGNYATDFMPVLPDLLHGNDYILSSPGDNLK
jgi:hypothetical protein